MKQKKLTQEQNIIMAIAFIATISAILAPLARFADAAATDTFSVSSTVSNTAPVIDWVQAKSDSPNEATTKITQVMFNASDINGVTTLNDSSAYVNISNGGVYRQSTSCTSTSINSTSRSYLCNITINYYEVPGSWDTNAYIRDNSSSQINLSGTTFTMGTTDSVDVVESSISFSGSPGTQDVAAGENPVTINNTGNAAYTLMGITAFNLLSGSTQIGAGNFSANITNSAIGQALTNNSNVNVLGSTLTRGASATRDIYVFLDIPAGIPPATYSSTSNWIVDPS